VCAARRNVDPRQADGLEALLRAGDGALRDELTSLVEALGLQRAALLVGVEAAQLARWLRADGEDDTEAV
jgi:hypothetical protein